MNSTDSGLKRGATSRHFDMDGLGGATQTLLNALWDVDASDPAVAARDALEEQRRDEARRGRRLR